MVAHPATDATYAVRGGVREVFESIGDTNAVASSSHWARRQLAERKDLSLKVLMDEVNNELAAMTGAEDPRS